KLINAHKNICILGLTATPYRLGFGWIYQYNANGTLHTEEDTFFKHCIYEISLQYMIKNAYLTPPILINSPVASYDFSSLKLSESKTDYSKSEIEKILTDQSRITPVIIKNIV